MGWAPTPTAPYYAMRFIRGDSLKEAADHFHADPATQSDPGRRSLELRELFAGSPTSATPSSTPTSAA